MKIIKCRLWVVLFLACGVFLAGLALGLLAVDVNSGPPPTPVPPTPTPTPISAGEALEMIISAYERGSVEICTARSIGSGAGFWGQLGDEYLVEVPTSVDTASGTFWAYFSNPDEDKKSPIVMVLLNEEDVPLLVGKDEFLDVLRQKYIDVFIMSPPRFKSVTGESDIFMVPSSREDNL